MSIYQFGLTYNIFVILSKDLVTMYKRIRELREDNDLLQRQLAEYLNCSQVAYSRYELGTRDIPTEVLISLADFYNTSTDYLLGRTTQKKPYNN